MLSPQAARRRRAETAWREQRGRAGLQWGDGRGDLKGVRSRAPSPPWPRRARFSCSC